MVSLSDGKARTITYLAAMIDWGRIGKPISAMKFWQCLCGALSGIVALKDELRASGEILTTASISSPSLRAVALIKTGGTQHP